MNKKKIVSKVLLITFIVIAGITGVSGDAVYAAKGLRTYKITPRSSPTDISFFQCHDQGKRSH